MGLWDQKTREPGGRVGLSRGPPGQRRFGHEKFFLKWAFCSYKRRFEVKQG